MIVQYILRFKPLLFSALAFFFTYCKRRFLSTHVSLCMCLWLVSQLSFCSAILHSVNLYVMEWSTFCSDVVSLPPCYYITGVSGTKIFAQRMSRSKPQTPVWTKNELWCVNLKWFWALSKHILIEINNDVWFATNFNNNNLYKIMLGRLTRITIKEFGKLVEWIWSNPTV